MSKFLDIWNGTFEGLPQDTEQESLGALRIRNLKVDISGRMKQDHSWAGDDSDGYHTAVTLLTQTSDPAPTPASGAAGSIYSKIVNAINELFFQDSSGNKTQITSAGTINLQGVVTGAILDFGGVTAPTGYLGCDGSAVSRTTYAALFAAIGTTWGVGDGSTTFNVPSLARHTTIGSGGTAISGPGAAVGNVGGEEVHTQTTTEMPNHNHTLTDPSHTHLMGNNEFTGTQGTTVFRQDSASLGTATAAAVTGISIAATGGGSAMNVMQPSAVVLKIIKT